MTREDSNLKVGKQTEKQVRDQKRQQRGDKPRPEQAKAPDAFHHQTDRERAQPEINHSQQGTDKAPESGTER